MLITPDAPLLVFWSLALLALMRLADEQRPSALYLLGLALGLGAVSKYTMALLLPGLLASFLLFPRLRRWWASPHLYLAALLAAVCLTPVLVWNAQNHWASFAKQLGHAFAGAPPPPLPNALAWLGSQAGLVTPLILLFCLSGMAWALWAGWREGRPKWFILGAVSLPIWLFFLNQSLHGGVQAHWAGPAYLSGIAAAAGAWCRSGAGRHGRLARGLFVAAPVLGVIFTLTVFFQAGTAALPIPLKADALKRLGGWDELAAAIEAERQAHPGAFLLTPKHEPTGVVSFHLPDHAPVFLQGRIRPSYYSAAEVAALKGHDAIVIIRARQDAAAGELAPFFRRLTPLRDVPLSWGGKPADLYRLYLGEDYTGGALVEGDGLDGARDAPP